MTLLAIQSLTSNQQSSYFLDENITGKLVESADVIFNNRCHHNLYSFLTFALLNDGMFAFLIYTYIDQFYIIGYVFAIRRFFVQVLMCCT